MVLGAVVDAGVDPDTLKTELNKLQLDNEFSIQFEKTTKHGITGTRAVVRTSYESDEEHNHPGHSHGPSRHLSDIFNILDASEIKEHIRNTAKQIFDKLAEAEAKVHNTDKDKVHLHEVSGIDSIVDIVGTVIGLSELGVKQVYSSPLSLGRGFVKCAHGMMPVPVPGTIELLHGIPIRQTEIPNELVTPTGAAIITTITNNFGVMPNMSISKIGYGAGTRDLEMQPNLLRICIGEIVPSINTKIEKNSLESSYEATTPNENNTIPGSNDSIEIIETNVDDMSPEVYSYLMDKLFENGALDVYFIPILMKKGRPAIQIKVLCSSNIRDTLIRVILTETTTFGVRFYAADRVILDRDTVEINTQWGPVQAKRGFLNDILIKTVPEYEDCKSLAESNGVPIQSVYQDAIRKT